MHSKLHPHIQRRTTEALMKLNSVSGGLWEAYKNKQHDLDSESEAALALTLLFEQSRGDASPFAAYIASLPSEPLSLVRYPPEIKAVLMGLVSTVAIDGLDHIVELVTKLASELVSPAPSKEAVLWALAIVASRSRAFAAPRYEIALLPICDLANHHPDGAAMRCSFADGGLACSSPGLASGSEVSSNYGDHLVASFLAKYGFRPAKGGWFRHFSFRIPEDVGKQFKCTDKIRLPHDASADNLWEALKCFRVVQMRTIPNGPEIQEFALEHGWFDLPFSALPKEKREVGDIDADTAYYLSVVEAKLLKLVPDLLQEQRWHDSAALAPLLKDMRQRRSSWVPQFRKLADEVEDAVRLDKSAADGVFRTLAEMQEHLA
eukprot:TRINITY_DN37354_c0_g1_i1.p1 TRINITY_DN37354_c0_g1~~TRINITY_DN37354_c0_g1_i1.p1  ORF type:complete len:376 (-),score=65.63 TRINITY_DN37354_c0_g1_i1:19-1146(-)